MSKYEVVFRGQSSVEATVIVEAASNEDAERIAEEETDPSTLDWEADPDSEVSGVYVSNSYLID